VVAFAAVTPNYFGEIPHLCLRCSHWHLARRALRVDPEYLKTVAAFTEAIN
jgi:hypothetical protein